MIIAIRIFYTGSNAPVTEFCVKGATVAERIANQIAEDNDLGSPFGSRRRQLDIRKYPRVSAENAHRTCCIELTVVPGGRHLV